MYSRAEYCESVIGPQLVIILLTKLHRRLSTTSKPSPHGHKHSRLTSTHSCTAVNKPPVLTVWLFYVLAMTYDLLTLGISTIYLVNFGSNAGK